MNDKHRNDIYGDNPHGDSASTPAIPAATVVLLRESETGIETLMLHRTSKVSFGGMWVFPGGRIDPEDHEGTDSELGAAYHAAARETLEETKLSVDPDAFAYFAHWTPPPGTPKRYSTYFFASQLPNETSIEVDGEEIQGHAWMSPSRALMSSPIPGISGNAGASASPYSTVSGQCSAPMWSMTSALA